MARFIEKKADGTVFSGEMTDDGLTQRYEQDVEPLLNYTKALRNDGLTDHGMRGDNMWLYAYIDATSAMDMMNRFGVNPFGRHDPKELFKLLNTEYRHLKTTEKTHTVK